MLLPPPTAYRQDWQHACLQVLCQWFQHPSLMQHKAMRLQRCTRVPAPQGLGYPSYTRLRKKWNTRNGVFSIQENLRMRYAEDRLLWSRNRKSAFGRNLNYLRLVWRKFQLYRAMQASRKGWDDLIECPWSKAYI